MSTLKRKAATQAGGADAKKAKQNGSIMSFFGPPKVTPAAGGPKTAAGGSNGGGSAVADAPAVKFDKEKWVASLTAEQRELLQLEITTLHDSWLARLKDEITTPEFLGLKKFLDRETAAGKKWFPPKEDVYSWSRHTPFNTVKVVIVGQDPYHNVNQAHGLAFSVRAPTPAPPSLKNMYTCLKNDYPSFVPPPNRGGLLTPWADRGVLMLNTCLTVRAHEANSHSNRGWERFTQRVIDLVAAKRTRGVVFMAWGTPAGKRVQKVDTKRHLVLKAVHPSPLSASRGYMTCQHYKLANEWLAERYGEETGPIDWALVEGHSVLGKKPAVEGEDKKKEKEEVEEDDDAEIEAALIEAELLAAEQKKKTELVKETKVAENEQTTTTTTTTAAAAVSGKKAAIKSTEGDENIAPKEEDVDA
ncbi:uracil-DNA glycosylase-like protein [Podospora didyma]|uniref:Uracil-DNA glycosylase n=1 Tax=Podospora didyma TaxID=330526 RepID=A0AAE0P6J3_9PEZI|nr:uracil-DNA glycosylase-like protein [Podospora didyma]